MRSPTPPAMSALAECPRLRGSGSLFYPAEERAHKVLWGRSGTSVPLIVWSHPSRLAFQGRSGRPIPSAIPIRQCGPDRAAVAWAPRPARVVDGGPAALPTAAGDHRVRDGRGRRNAPTLDSSQQDRCSLMALASRDFGSPDFDIRGAVSAGHRARKETSIAAGSASRPRPGGVC